MARIELAERIKQDLFILDGAMGTQLFARDVKSDKGNDYLNIESPQTIAAIHGDYFNAGSDAVLTNTFGANKYALARHGIAEMAEEINRAGAAIAREAAGEDRYVLGDIGPTGDFLKPLGLLEPDELRAAFAIQTKGLVAGGVDGLLIETMTAIEEAAIAVEAVQSVCELPIFVSLAFDPAADDFRTMMGASVDSVVSRIAAAGVNAIGFNCGTLLMQGYVELTQKYAELLADSDLALLAEPNAGLPEMIDGQTVYKLDADTYADYAQQICDAGAQIIGGCCGTSPAHIKALAEKLRTV